MLTFPVQAIAIGFIRDTITIIQDSVKPVVNIKKKAAEIWNYTRRAIVTLALPDPHPSLPHHG